MDIKSLNPQSLWQKFYELTRIPRPSKKEGKVIEALVDLGEYLGLKTFVDEVGNVIIRKPATAGMKNRKDVILQCHMDMVPQKNSNKVHDFETDPIEAIVDGEWVKANGTTLGADNGIGVAATMAFLALNYIGHGPVTALFTVNEETGLTGAFGLKPGILPEDAILLNLDSEDEGELYVSCAGGTNVDVLFNYKEELVPENSVAFKISLTGLKGGHSGADIHLGRGNANKIMNKLLLDTIHKFELRLVSIDGGSLRNAIPRESFVIITIPAEVEGEFKEYVINFLEEITKEFFDQENAISLILKDVELPTSVIDLDTTKYLFESVNTCRNGVISMSKDMEDLVQTSNNLAIIKSENGTIKVQCLLRSSVDPEKKEWENILSQNFKLAGGEVSFSGQYPGWKMNPDSEIVKLAVRMYEGLFEKQPEIKAIHAGLECGVLGGTYPGWDMISFGPTIRFPHSPDEKVNIATVQKFWDYLVELLKNIPVK